MPPCSRVRPAKRDPDWCNQPFVFKKLLLLRRLLLRLTWIPRRRDIVARSRRCRFGSLRRSGLHLAATRQPAGGLCAYVREFFLGSVDLFTLRHVRESRVLTQLQRADVSSDSPAIFHTDLR